MAIVIEDIEKELIGKSASFTKESSGPFILKDISKIKRIWELEVDAIVAKKENPIYGVEGVLVQPHTEIPEDPRKLITVFVYLDTEIKILDEVSNCWSNHNHYY